MARNEIMDQSSLIARYQQEIQLLKGQLDMVLRERELLCEGSLLDNRALGAGREPAAVVLALHSPTPRGNNPFLFLLPHAHLQAAACPCTTPCTPKSARCESG